MNAFAHGRMAACTTKHRRARRSAAHLAVEKVTFISYGSLRPTLQWERMKRNDRLRCLQGIYRKSIDYHSQGFKPAETSTVSKHVPQQLSVVRRQRDRKEDTNQAHLGKRRSTRKTLSKRKIEMPGRSSRSFDRTEITTTIKSSETRSSQEGCAPNSAQRFGTGMDKDSSHLHRLGVRM